jgi:3-methyladenine DNA glycosylase AlkD
MPKATVNKPVPSPKELADSALASLKRLSSLRRARGAQAYFKEAVKVMGARAEDVRKLAADLSLQVKRRWDFDQAVDFGEILLPNPFLEAKAQGILVLGRFIPQAHPVFFLKMRSWFQAGHLGNWASTDLFCSEILSPFVTRFPELRHQFKTWTQSKNLWVQRASAVALVPFARRGQWLDLAYDVAGRLFPSEQDLIHKASGWLLREAGKTNMPRLEKFLRSNGSRMPRTALRYALEKFSPAKRKAIQKATSGRGGSL